MAQIIDTPAEVRDWKLRMRRVALAHHVTIPDGYNTVVPIMGPQARDLMHLLASHANGYHGQHVPDDRTLNGALQAWLLTVDPLAPPPLILVQPAAGAHIIGGLHQTEGLPGYPAYDFGAPAGTTVVACETSTVTRFSGHDPNLGPVEGIHGPFGWSIYLRGRSGSDYYYTHLGTRTVTVGAVLQPRQRIGTIGDYARWGGANHVHLGVHAAAGGVTIEDVRAAPEP